MVLIAPQKKNNFLAPTWIKNLLNNRPSIRVRNFALLNEPLNIFTFFFILTPKSPTRGLYGVKIKENPSD
jgi:hypothetical protein